MARGLGFLGWGGASPLRRAALLGLVLVVIGVHGCVASDMADRLGDFGAAASSPKRIEVAYVRDMALAPPPTVAPQPLVAPATRRALVAPAAPVEPVAKAASSPEPAASSASAPATLVAQVPADEAASTPAPEPPPEAASAAPESAESAESPLIAAAAAAAAAASNAATAAVAPASAASSISIDWPASTRMSYLLTGNYRGSVEGHAQVEWARVGSHYQAHLDLVVGPGFAPLITRRTTSDGEITDEGLAPRRYDEDTEVMFRDHRHIAIQFEPGAVLLPSGQRVPSLPGVQDAASQFVQLTYLFMVRPELLRAGQTIDIPLALGRRVSHWTYDVLGEETIHTGFGPLQAFHLRPQPGSIQPRDLSAEIWFAPQLRYLPVRIRIQQDEQTYIDLMIERKPEMAAP